MTKPSSLNQARLLLGFMLLGLLTLGATSAQPAQADPPRENTWTNTNFKIDKEANFCVDTGNYNQIVFYDANAKNPGPGTYSLNLTSGKRTFLNTHRADVCGPNGFFYEQDVKGGKGGYRFSSVQPGEDNLEYMPQQLAVDGSQYAYWLVSASNYRGIKRVSKFMVSSDAGLTWQERGQQLEGQIQGVAMSKNDARLVYATTQSEKVEADSKRLLTIWLSKDAGLTWEKRSESLKPDLSENGLAFSPQTFGSYLAPSNILLLQQPKGGLGSTYSPEYFISQDGGQTFDSLVDSAILRNPIINYNGNAVLRLSVASQGEPKLEIYNSDKTWQTIKVPGDSKSPLASFTVSPVVKGTIFVTRQSGQILYSPDSGKSWQIIGNPGDWSDPNTPAGTDKFGLRSFTLTPYLPGKIIGLTYSGTLVTFDSLLTNDKVTLESKQPNTLTADNLYFTETGHNLAGLFRQYWEANGGVAQFGYPKTDPVPEYNPADGKIYTVQYFERARFEYHPENKGTKYEVLLGLLGNQLAEKYRNSAHIAFKNTTDKNYPGGTYFPETGHNLRNPFKSYWEANGGLALYGFPISEEFEEVNPDDGKTYVVQLFERNRFEYHPENKGTKYEVLLGLLGNQLLRDKGWLN